MNSGNSSFLLQLYKALEETNELSQIAKQYGIDMMQISSKDTNNIISLYWAKSTLENLLHTLATGKTFMTTGGREDYRSRSLIVIENICYVAAIFNNVSKKFMRLGIELQDNAFDGCYQRAVTAYKKAFERLCGISYIESSILNTVSLYDYRHSAEKLFHTYEATANLNVESIFDNW